MSFDPERIIQRASEELTHSYLLQHLRWSDHPFASRTFQYTKEQLGQAEDKVRSEVDSVVRIARGDALTAKLMSDPAPSRLYRSREARRCAQGGAPEDALRDVRLLNLAALGAWLLFI